MGAHGVVAAGAHVVEDLRDRALDVDAPAPGLTQRGDHGRRIVAEGQPSHAVGSVAHELAQAGDERPQLGGAQHASAAAGDEAHAALGDDTFDGQPRDTGRRDTGRRGFDQRDHAVGQPVGDRAVEGADDLDDRDIEAAPAKYERVSAG